MRRLILSAAVLLFTAALSASPALAAPPTGGAAFDPDAAEPLHIRAFSLTSATVAPGAPASAVVRVDGPVPRVRLRVDLLAAGSRRVVKRISLGSRRTGRRIETRWSPGGAALVPGEYGVRLLATAPDGRRARRAGRTPLLVVAPPPPAAPAAPPSSFPVQGPYTFGGDDARFGAGRPGHSHQGQDILAAEGTPVVSPAAGVVHWRAYQGAGAGHYLVLRSPGLGDHAYMHLREGSITVDKGAAVAPGQRIAEVGNTGRSSAPHLHFELWPGGWWEGDSRPVDPRPALEAWAAGR